MRDDLEFARELGHSVPALEDRPRIPPHLAIVTRAAADLAGDQTLAGFPFVAVAAWCDRVGGVDPFWLADRLRAHVTAAARTDAPGAAHE